MKRVEPPLTSATRRVERARFVIEQWLRPEICRLSPYTSARSQATQGLLLDANENPYDQSWEGLPLNRYPDPEQTRLRRRLSDLVGVGPEKILAGAGSDEPIDWLLKAFCRPAQDAVAVFPPTYDMYRVQSRIWGAEVLDFPLDQDFDLPLDFIRQVPDRVRLVFLCSPNNPTGNRLDCGRVLELCTRWPGPVVVDEAYVEFCSRPSLVRQLDYYPNLIVLRTLSKAWGGAGIRLGYVVAAQSIIAELMKIKAPYNLGTVNLELACRLLAGGRLEVDIMRICRERERLAQALQALPAVSKVFHSETNFLLFRCRRARQVMAALREQGIVIRDRGNLPGLKNCLRITVGTPAQNDRLLDCLNVLLGGCA